MLRSLDQQIRLVRLVWNVRSISVAVARVLITTKIVIREPCTKNAREYCAMSVKVEILSNSKAHVHRFGDRCEGPFDYVAPNVWSENTALWEHVGLPPAFPPLCRVRNPV
jgi:hypothetical protein